MEVEDLALLEIITLRLGIFLRHSAVPAKLQAWERSRW